MELQSAIKLLVLGQVLSLAIAGDNATTIDRSIKTVAYTVSGPRPNLFKVGGDRVEMKVEGCFKFNSIVCCYNQPVADGLVEGSHVCTQFGPANCCSMIPGPDVTPRVPQDLVPLVPALSPGQCEQRRRGRRVLHCCRGGMPRDALAAGKVSTLCHSVGDMMCCYHPFAGFEFGIRMRRSKGNSAVALIVAAQNKAEE